MALRGYIKTKLFALAVCLAGLFLFVPSVYSQAYGGGNYGACKYSQGCSSATFTPTGNGTGSSSESPDTTSKIILNNYDDYFTDGGVQLDLKEGQVIYVDIIVNGETVRYTITVTNVGDDFVDLLIGTSGKTKIKVHLVIGEIKKIDLDGDGTLDISITLNGIKNGKASFTFKVLGATTQTPVATTSTPKKSSINWLLWLSLAAIILGALISIILAIKKRRDKNNKPIQF